MEVVNTNSVKAISNGFGMIQLVNLKNQVPGRAQGRRLGRLFEFTALPGLYYREPSIDSNPKSAITVADFLVYRCNRIY